jgi:hypothetical protein
MKLQCFTCSKDTKKCMVWQCNSGVSGAAGPETLRVHPDRVAHEKNREMEKKQLCSAGFSYN